MQRGTDGVKDRLKYAFFDWLLADKFSKKDIQQQQDVTDLRFASEFYVEARSIQRTIHVHVGPTNSGKTYNALKRLEEAGAGIYAGPLRLLAHEVFTRLKAKGLPACLLTGEERRFPTPQEMEEITRSGFTTQNPDTPLISCTVEMVPAGLRVPVAVLDEIQMLGDPDRGWAWTQAFLGLNTEELHVCGEVRTVPLIKELAALVGDRVVVHEYARLSPLAVETKSLGGSLKKLQKGDAVISFSVVAIQRMKREIEKATKKNVAMVYGSLPPEIRAQQARLFNDPNNDYDYLVASDAIGMGLNLSIKRVIFESTIKFNGQQMKPLEISDLKQIGGRAGRYKTAQEAITTAEDVPTDPVIDPDDGFRPGTISKVREESESVVDIIPAPSVSTGGSVTTLDDLDLPLVTHAFQTEAEPLTKAGIRPPNDMVQRFGQYFPNGTPFSYLLQKLYDTLRLPSTFMLCPLKDEISIAEALEPVEGLTLEERNNMCLVPLPPKDENDRLVLQSFGRAIAARSGGGLLDLEAIDLSQLEETTAVIQEPSTRLRKLVQLHKQLVAYLWLSFRFSNVFTTRNLANHVKGLVEAQMEVAIANLRPLNRKKAQERKMKALQSLLEDGQLDQDQSDEDWDFSNEFPGLVGASPHDQVMERQEEWQSQDSENDHKDLVRDAHKDEGIDSQENREDREPREYSGQRTNIGQSEAITPTTL
ncbi:hypothetical protein EJ05DRAFT_443544 [Pseudovirgaria hyperparasitica]|uniref:RNA helicase n=1 Tax=Pseudovirgaria hyperparasitica TaxID=470096 RepID=A0A6A6VV53_9PEZI|nr:uncharacterized protein EJ05DRAFT_443544 [Pseudovirgaria hyperparasitica]KAF2754442.1 hypothetical protein EJ05DRAFT_443544 [Pseudovirgaria hyperparasitica]